LDELFLKRALELSVLGPELKMGHPFGCVVVKDDRIVGEGYNQVTSTNDPSAHAEVMAIRDACRNMKTPQLLECTIYTSCEPCPMCLGAIYWANAKRVVFANPKEALAKIEFEDQFVYD
jgi:guanine deaminase